jgi:hypothetical protein
MKERVMKRKSVLRSIYTVGVFLVVTLFAVSIVVPLQGCAALNPKELTRASAFSLLRGHSMFKKPAVLPLNEAEKFPVPAESSDEPEPVERAVELFFEDRPAMGVLRHLGLVEAMAVAVERPQRLAYTGYLTTWKFKITPRLTADGKKAVRAAGGEGEAAVPLLRREVVEVTGVTKEGGNSARVEFTWKSAPTPAGEAFDPTRPAFKSLPPALQQKLTRVNVLGNSLKMSFGEVRRATARMRLYDDGWRVEGLSL